MGYVLAFPNPDTGRPERVVNSECPTRADAELFLSDRIANGQAFPGEYVVLERPTTIRDDVQPLVVARQRAERRNRDAENAVLGCVRRGEPVPDELREQLLATDETFWVADAEVYLRLRVGYGIFDVE